MGFPYLVLKQKFRIPTSFISVPASALSLKKKKNSYSCFFLTSSPSPSCLKLFKVQLGRRMHVCRIKESVETIKRFGMWKCSEGATVCIYVAPERLPHAGEASGKGSRQSDCTPGHKNPHNALRLASNAAKAQGKGN